MFFGNNSGKQAEDQMQKAKTKAFYFQPKYLSSYVFCIPYRIVRIIPVRGNTIVANCVSGARFRSPAGAVYSFQTFLILIESYRIDIMLKISAVIK